MLSYFYSVSSSRFQNLAGELRPWILSNPIYVRLAATEAAAK